MSAVEVEMGGAADGGVGAGVSSSRSPWEATPLRLSARKVLALLPSSTIVRLPRAVVPPEFEAASLKVSGPSSRASLTTVTLTSRVLPLEGICTRLPGV